jgi:hypothetical protein
MKLSRPETGPASPFQNVWVGHAPHGESRRWSDPKKDRETRLHPPEFLTVLAPASTATRRKRLMLLESSLGGSLPTSPLRFRQRTSTGRMVRPADFGELCNAPVYDLAMQLEDWKACARAKPSERIQYWHASSSPRSISTSSRRAKRS